MYFFVFIGENKLTYLLKKIFLRIDSGGATNLIKLLTLENWTVKITSTFGLYGILNPTSSSKMPQQFRSCLTFNIFYTIEENQQIHNYMIHPAIFKN